jgi:DNA mismatch endonuclease (patch repair protein)
MPATRSFKRLERRLVSDELPATTSVASNRMGRIRQRDTDPELRVRRIVASMGLRFTTSNRDLPGSPDLANRTKKWALFVHGCFWHQHAGCPAATVPKSNRVFWQSKFSANRERDARVREALEALGFTVITVWECETRVPSHIRDSISSLRSN